MRYDATVTADRRRRVIVPIPFEPDDVWGPKAHHHVAGTVNGMRVRAVVEPLGDGHGIVLGAAWRRDCGIAPGDQVAVVLVPEGPQRADLAPDVAAALDAEPAAGPSSTRSRSSTGTRTSAGSTPPNGARRHGPPGSRPWSNC
jgi:hypothetical protein